jgi:hypothetical protein
MQKPSLNRLGFLFCWFWLLLPFFLSFGSLRTSQKGKPLPRCHAFRLVYSHFGQTVYTRLA